MISLDHLLVKTYGGLCVKGSYEMSGGSPPHPHEVPSRPTKPPKKKKKK